MSIEAMRNAVEAMDKHDFEMADHILCQAIAEAEKQEQGEQETNRLIQQRDHAHEIIDKLCDAVLGFDRHEWSSAYFFEDAVNEVEEKMWQLSKQEQNEPAPVQELEIDLRTRWPMNGWKENQPTTPQQRKPLTDEQIETIRQQPQHHKGEFDYEFDELSFARAIEAAHGIKE